MRRAASVGTKKKAINDREKRMQARALTREANLAPVDNRGRSPIKPTQSRKRDHSSSVKPIGKVTTNPKSNTRTSSRDKQGNQKNNQTPRQT